MNKRFLSIPMLVLIFLMDLKFLDSAVRNLRPIADDYCLAAVANKNVISNVNTWFQQWSGDIFQLLTSYFVAGYPLYKFPYGIGSAITLVISLMLLSAVIYFTVTSKNKFKKFSKYFFGYFVVTVFVVASWITFWWLPTLINAGDEGAKIASEQYLATVLNWQTVNSSYVIQTCITILLVFNILDKKVEKFSKSLPIIFIFGFLIGTSGYVIALSILTFLVLEIFTSKNKNNNVVRVQNQAQGLFFIVSIAAGILTSYFSPGARIRSGYFNELEFNFGAILTVFINSLSTWVDAVASIENLYLIFIGVFVAILLNSFNVHLIPKRINLMFQRLLLLSFLTYVLSKISELFSYVAFWHSMYSDVLIYLSFILIGIWLGLFFQIQITKIYFPLTVTILSSLLLLSIVGLNEAENRIEIRRLQWDSGPAPAIYGQPGDRESDWVNKCWKDLVRLKSQ